MVGGYLLTRLTGFLLKASQGFRHQGCWMRNLIRDQKLTRVGWRQAYFFAKIGLGGPRAGQGQGVVKRLQGSLTQSGLSQR